MIGVPVPLVAVRVLLLLWTGIVALVYFLSLVGLVVVEPVWFERQGGLTRGTALALTAVAALRLPFQVYVAATLGRGGRRTRLLVRLTVVFGYLCAAVDRVNGVNPVLAVAVPTLLLLLNEIGPSRRWYTGVVRPEVPGRPDASGRTGRSA
ncbi:hypothetical protein [Nocardiopsis kunsanensis]|uniref:hypothetical protein n=1 Tax=Nocardiopsis kunsanensis TaxID=141693 RepID=UPI0003638279|nr:hypothetical protein [Nocardiopsis kunsanensis]